MEATIRYYTNRCKASTIGDIDIERLRVRKEGKKEEREREREKLISSYDLS